MDWFRWHHGTTIDPKWRVVSRKSGQPIHAVVAVWAVFLERASESNPRGSIDGWVAEDVGASLDLDPNEVQAIYDAMQGKVLEGDETHWMVEQAAEARTTRRLLYTALAGAQETPGRGNATPCNTKQHQATPSNAQMR